MKTNGPFLDKFAFLNDFVDTDSNPYQDASWLSSCYMDPVWVCTFEKTTRVLDFQVRLDDSSLLTDAKNEVLLRSLKSWLCIQGHPTVSGYRVNAPITTYVQFKAVLHVIDYFLLNSTRFGLAKFGLNALTSDDIKGFFNSLATGATLEFAIYRWDQKLTEYLKKGGDTVSDKEIDFYLKESPMIGSIRRVDEPILALDEGQLVKARIYLWRQNFYGDNAQQNSDYLYMPNTTMLCDAIYPDTIFGCNPHRTPEELCFGWRKNYQRELDGVPVKNWEGDLRSEKNIRKYVDAIRSMGLLSATKLPVPHWALEATADQAFLKSLPTRSSGRFKTVPYEVVSRSLKDSIEFILKYGNDIAESFLNLIKAAIEAGAMCLHGFTTGKDITPFLTPVVRNMGVRYWSLHYTMQCLEPGITYRDPESRPPPSEFFSRFRSNEGLYELLEVLYGAVQVCVGTLMARRQGEFNDLESEEALDISKSYLLFRNRKTGVHGCRVLTARPIPNIGIEAISLLQRLQDGLVELGAIENHGKLFAMPHARYLNLKTFVNSNIYLDRFCDYFELPLDQHERRYYLRQHQLRRNFAMVFFWGASFGGVETLQWFLGHADPEQLYNYITETMPGKTLTSVKAAHAAYLLVRDDPEVRALSDVIEEHFGTRNFSVLDYDELQEYIADLLEEDKVTVEPQFFKIGKSKHYRILILVKETP